MIWTYKTYSETIRAYQDAGYELGSFENFLYSQSSKFIVLRHDLDFDPTLLLPMIEVEHSLGVTSTSFFRVAAKNYNYLSATVCDLLHDIHSVGGSSGLHLDCGIESSWEKSLEESAEIQRNTFDSISPEPMKGFSLHQPTNNGGYEFANELVAKWKLPYHAYDDQFFSNMKYLSDSGGRWREGHWGEKVNHFDQMQVLTHPIWHHNGTPQRSF